MQKILLLLLFITISANAQNFRPTKSEIHNAIKKSINATKNGSGKWTFQNKGRPTSINDTIHLFENPNSKKWCDHVDWEFKRTNKMRLWEYINDNCNVQLGSSITRQSTSHKIVFDEEDGKTFLVRYFKRKLTDKFEVISLETYEIINGEKLKKITLVKIQ
jgi:hypothetical protein